MKTPAALSRRPSCWVLAAFLLFAQPQGSVLRAADRFWTNINGGNFTNITNWASSTAPGAADNAVFASNASYQVTWTVSRTNANAFFNAHSGTVTQAIGATFWV